MPARPAEIVFQAPPTQARWALPERNMPEGHAHRLTVELLAMILAWWAHTDSRNVLVARNLAVRWDRRMPKVGVDPDVCLVEPPPPRAAKLKSLKLWETDHVAPRIAIEVVSATNADKDYVEAPAKYAASGTRELWIFDPDLEGPSLVGGPHVLQIWRRGARNRFTRVHAGATPAFSRELGAWLVLAEEGTRLRIANDANGRDLWLTESEAERAAKDAALAAKEAERAAKDAALAAKEVALARVAELEARLARTKRRR